MSPRFLFLLSLSVVVSMVNPSSATNADVRFGRYNMTESAVESGHRNYYYLNSTTTLCSIVVYDVPFQVSDDHTTVLMSINHFGRRPDPTQPLPASTGWFDINYSGEANEGFEVCVNDNTTHVNRTDDGKGKGAVVQFDHHPDLHVDWFAFQGNPFSFSQGGRIRLPKVGTRFYGVGCRWINFSPPFKGSPRLLVALEHQTTGRHPLRHQDTAWVEAVDHQRARVCARDEPIFETSGHRSIHINYLAFDPSKLPNEPHAQSGSVLTAWPNSPQPSKDMLETIHHPFDAVHHHGHGDDTLFPNAPHRICINVTFSTPFDSVPYVFVTASHRGEREKTKDFEATTAWVEELSERGFRGCVTEMWYHDGPHEPIWLEWLAFDDLFMWDPMHKQRMMGVRGSLFMRLDYYYFTRSSVPFASSIQSALTEAAGIAAARVNIKNVSDASGQLSDVPNLMIVEFDIAPPENGGLREMGAVDAMQKIDDQIARETGSFWQTKFAAEYLSDAVVAPIAPKNNTDGAPPPAKKKNKRSPPPLSSGAGKTYPPFNMPKAWLEYRADCVVGPWTIDGKCSSQGKDKCDRMQSGFLRQRREMVRQKSTTGKECPPLTRNVPCNIPPCWEEAAGATQAAGERSPAAVSSQMGGSSREPVSTQEAAQAQDDFSSQQSMGGDNLEEIEPPPGGNKEKKNPHRNLIVAAMSVAVILAIPCTGAAILACVVYFCRSKERGPVNICSADPSQVDSPQPGVPKMVGRYRQQVDDIDITRTQRDICDDAVPPAMQTKDDPAHDSAPTFNRESSLDEIELATPVDAQFKYTPTRLPPLGVAAQQQAAARERGEAGGVSLI